MHEEIWLPVVGYEGLYEISNHGGVRSLERTGLHAGRWGIAKMKFPARVMSVNTSETGYRYIKLVLPGRRPKHFLVHRLVMAAHVGAPAEGMQVNHKDGDKANNYVGNLEYCSSRGNLRHCIDVLGKKRGEGAASKLKEANINSIRRDNRTLREIAVQYGVTLQAIWMVKKRRNWSHVPEMAGE